MKKVYLAEVIHPDAEKKLRDYAEVVDNFQHIEELDGILLRAHRMDRSMIARAKRCKVIARHGVGMDILDVAACREFGIPITYTPGANSFSVAEFGFAMALALMRNLYQAEYLQKTKGFSELGPISLRGYETYGKTVGIIGAFGRVGQHLAQMYQGAFHCRVLGFDPFATSQQLNNLGIEPAETLEELVSYSDIIHLTCPLTAETRGMFQHQLFGSVKKGAVLINTARGELVDESALYTALTDGTLRACGSDVFCDELHSFQSPLNQLDNFIGFPHMAANTYESMERMAMWAVDDLIAVLEGQPPKYLYTGN